MAATAEALIKELAARPLVRAALAEVERAAAALVDETVRVTEIAAPTFAEGRRAAHVAERFRALGLDGVETAADGNVYGRLVGEDAHSPARLALYVHLDTVFGPTVAVTVSRRENRLFAPGIGDNSAGVGGVLGALSAFQQAGLRPARSVWIVATTGEEGLGDLCGARAATDRLGDELDAVIAVEGSFYGRLSHTAVGSQRLRVTMRGGGGHSWHDFGRPSAVHALVRAAAAISRLDVPSEPRVTYNIGEISGGTGVNVLAEEASLLLDLRSADPSELARLAERVQGVLAESRKEGVTVTVEEVGNRPAGAMPAGHALAQGCAAVLNHFGVAPHYPAASTDANIPLGRGIPAVTLGITRGGGAHTLGEWIETGPLVRGVQQLILVLCLLTEPPADPYRRDRLG